MEEIICDKLTIPQNEYGITSYLLLYETEVQPIARLSVNNKYTNE